MTFNHHYKKQLFTFHICNYLVGLFRTKAYSYPVDRDVKLNRLYERELQKHRKRHETMKCLGNLSPLVPQLGDLICMQIFTLFSRRYSCLFPLYTIDTPLTLRPSCRKYQAERKKVLWSLPASLSPESFPKKHLLLNQLSSLFSPGYFHASHLKQKSASLNAACC